MHPEGVWKVYGGMRKVFLGVNQLAKHVMINTSVEILLVCHNSTLWSMKDSEPLNLTRRLKFCVESDLEVEDVQILGLDLNTRKSAHVSNI